MQIAELWQTAPGRPAAPRSIAFQRRRFAAGRAMPARIRDPLRRIEDEAERRRMRENLAAAVIVALLLGAGYWSDR